MQHVGTLLCCLLLSCDLTLNRDIISLYIHTYEPSIIILGSDSVRTEQNSATFTVPRSKQTLMIVAVADSIQKTVHRHTMPMHYTI